MTCGMRGAGAGSAMIALLLTICVTATASAQRRGRYFDPGLADASGYYVPPDFKGNHPYDGRFTWARIKYKGYFGFGPEGPGWAHDYPRSDSHVMAIMREVTSLRPYLGDGALPGGNIFSTDDPELCKYPIAYFSEPGGWNPDEKEVLGFRHYLQAGGFVIFDDFGFPDQWYNVVQQFQRVLPNAKILPLSKDHPIFDSFFKIDVEHIPWSRQAAYRGVPAYFAIFEDNDPTKRPYAIFNYNLDIGESWEFSDEGFEPVASSNEAYKLGVNYLIYALTH
jgi:hypothetical protein